MLKKSLLACFCLWSIFENVLSYGNSQGYQYQKILRHDCQSRNWFGQYREKRLEENMSIKPAVTTITTKSPSNLYFCSRDEILR